MRLLATLVFLAACCTPLQASLGCMYGEDGVYREYKCPYMWRRMEFEHSVKCIKPMVVPLAEQTLEGLLANPCKKVHPDAVINTVDDTDENHYRNWAVKLLAGHYKKRGKWYRFDGQPIYYMPISDKMALTALDGMVTFAENERWTVVTADTALQKIREISCRLQPNASGPCSTTPKGPYVDLRRVSCSRNSKDGADVWVKKYDCYGNIKCYSRIPMRAPDQNGPKVVYNNLCSTLNPAAMPASIHCVEEDKLALSFSSAIFFGLYIPPNMPWNAKSFRWFDGTPLDYTNWGHLQPNNLVPIERNVKWEGDGWHDFPGVDSYLLCKLTPAISREPEPWKHGGEIEPPTRKPRATTKPPRRTTRKPRATTKPPRRTTRKPRATTKPPRRTTRKPTKIYCKT